MHDVTDKLVARLIEAEKIQNAAAKSQSKLQFVTIALTVVIALSTVLYTWITWQSVQAQREANQIQRKILDPEAKAKAERPSKPTVEMDARKSGTPQPGR